MPLHHRRPLPPGLLASAEKWGRTEGQMTPPERQKEMNRQRAMAGEAGYASIGPPQSRMSRILDHLRYGIPRRVEEFLEPETPAGLVGLLGASVMEPAGTAIDVADFAAGWKDRDLGRMGWAAGGAAIPLVAGSTMRKVLGKGAKAADELPMDEASRMARAEEMGFDKDVYHGTSVPEEITELRPSRMGEFGPGVYTTDTASEAAGYTGAYANIGQVLEGSPARIMPLKIRLRNPLRITDPDEFWKRFGKEGATDRAAQEAAIEAGYDGIIITRPQVKPGVWPPTPIQPEKIIEHQVVFDPKNIRSRFAAFDPAQAESANLVAGGAGLLGAGLARNQRERE